MFLDIAIWKEMLRTHYCGLIDRRFLGKTVTLYGWAHRRRDHGGVIFIDLRDREGVIQIVCNPDNLAVFEHANHIRNEYVLKVVGTVHERPEGMLNPKLISGEIEVITERLEILNPSVTPPFLIEDEHLAEQTRLSYRVLDLRRPVMQKNLRTRFEVMRAFRAYLEQQQFIEIETPILTKSTPEGARDYLVPSRVHPGKFFALPQSPQLFKQLLMIAGFDRYYQITRCFRDEDLRADRQPEFTQIDIEASFVDQHAMMAVAENLIKQVFQQVASITLPSFPKVTYAEAMQQYGSDKPDLRIPLVLTELTDLMKSESFKVFREAADKPDGRVVGLRIPQGDSLTRSEIDHYTELVRSHGAKGLAYIKVKDPNRPDDQGLQSPIVKFLSADTLSNLLSRTQAQPNDLIFFGADRQTVVNEAMGALRVKIGQDLGLSRVEWQPLWITDFPMFEYGEEEKRWKATHHPFTSPKDGHAAWMSTDPGRCLAKAYDLVLNGWEIGGGSIRIHTAEVQTKAFEALQIDAESAQEQFGFLLDNLKFGAPPHGGIAFGLDRLVALLVGAESIRDVIAFPKTQRVHCLLTDAPSAVHAQQLEELHIQLRPNKPMLNLD